MSKNTVYLGNKVMVSDPCYSLNTWCQGVLENVKEGEYEAYFKRNNDESIVEISLVNEENINDVLRWDKENFDVGVDSGQAGIFDYEYYAKYHTEKEERTLAEDRWYDKVSDMTSGLVKNPDFVSFLTLPDYISVTNNYKAELETLKEKYENLDIETPYKEIVSHYEELDSPLKKNASFDMDGLLDSLRNLKKVLEEMEDENYVAPEISEEEKALSDVKFAYEKILHNMWKDYSRSKIGQREKWMKLASVVDGKGYVCSSGDGDGSYDCYTAKDENGKIIAIMLDFSYECYDEEEELED